MRFTTHSRQDGCWQDRIADRFSSLTKRIDRLFFFSVVLRCEFFASSRAFNGGKWWRVFFAGVAKTFLQHAKGLQEAPFACRRKEGESREMPRCRVVYRCKSGCFRCGRKSVVSPFVKTNGQLICRSCYCFEKRQSAESEEASTAG